MRKFGSFTKVFIIIFTLLLAVSCSPVNNQRADSNETLKPAGLYLAASYTLSGTKWGYIDNKGHFVIEPVFDSAEDFQENGLAIAGTVDKSGIIDKSGKYIIEPAYSYINPFTEGLAIAAKDKEYVVLNEGGTVIFSIDGYIHNFRDERAAVYKNVPNDRGLYGFIDKSGKMVIEPIYKYVYDFKNGKAVVNVNEGKFQLINKSGEALQTYNHFNVGDLCEGMMTFKNTYDDYTGYINEKDEVVIKPIYRKASCFQNGIAIVSPADGRTGAIDKHGKYIIKPEYNEILQLGEGMTAVGILKDKKILYKGSMYAIADKNGVFLTDFKFYSVNEYKYGYASVYDGKDTYFIDKTGNKADALPTAAGAGILMKVDTNMFKAYIDNRVFYTDSSGKIIWKPISKIELGNGITIYEEKYNPNKNYLIYYPRLGGVKDSNVEEAINKKLHDMAIVKDIGTEQELEYDLTGDYNTEYYNKNLLVIKLYGYDFPFGAAHGMPYMKYAHINLINGVFYNLSGLFKKDSDYTAALSDIVKKQIEAEGEESGIWLDSYKGIKEEQPFIITKDALKLYFEPYEIAPYAAGFPTFTVPYTDIMNIIDTEGELWKAFN